MSVELHPHQVEAVEKMHNGCILYGDVGVGKTITSLSYYFTKVCSGELNSWGSMQTPKDVYVITTAKVRDSKGFELQAAAMGIHQDRAVSTNGVKITVDSWNNLHKHVEVKDAFFIFDEQRVVGYGAWSRAFIKIARHNEWVLLSATPGDTWLDYIPVFIANGWYKHKTDFTDQHVIWAPRVKYPKVLRYQNVGDLVRRRNQVLVRMPLDRHTTRHMHDLYCEYDKDLLDKAVKKRWHVFENRPLRDAAELFGVMRKIVNSDSSRLSEVKRLLETHPKLIVFYNFDYELEMLRTLVPAGQLASPESIRDLKRKLDTQPHISSSHPSRSAGKERSKSGNSAGGKPTPPSSSGANGNGDCETDQPAIPVLTAVPATSTDDIAKFAKNLDVLSDWEWLLSPEGTKANERLIENSLPEKSSSLSSGESQTTSGNGSRSSRTETTMPRTGCGELSDTESKAGYTTQQTSKSFAVTEWNGHKHEEIPATERWLYLVQYRAGAEGWNCVETDAMIFFSQTYSYRDWSQAHGRIDRLNTPFIDLHYYHFVSSSQIDRAIRAALKAKKNFNEKDFKF